MRHTARTLSTVAVAATLAAGLAPAAQAVDHDRIVGGSEATSDVGAVSLGQTDDFSSSFCSATLLTETKVLTAKHCTDAVDEFWVRVGSLANGSGGTVIKAASVASQNDVSVVTLAEPATGATTVELSDTEPSVGDENQIFGWGRTDENGPVSPVLKTADVEVSGFTTDAFGGRAISSDGINGSAWKGDSGGPQFADGKQVGVASTASYVGQYQNYASVPENFDFITNEAGL
ncbi:S1 family peptidase [Dermacoccaceae bacterium W4C1]